MSFGLLELVPSLEEEAPIGESAAERLKLELVGCEDSEWGGPYSDEREDSKTPSGVVPIPTNAKTPSGVVHIPTNASCTSWRRLDTATRLAVLRYRCVAVGAALEDGDATVEGGKGVDVGGISAAVYVVSPQWCKSQLATVCRICHGPGRVQLSDEDDEGEGEALWTDVCGCRGSVGAIHARCLMAWFDSRGQRQGDLRCGLCLQPYTNDAGLALSRSAVAARTREAAQAPPAGDLSDDARGGDAAQARRAAAVDEATQLWRSGSYAAARATFEAVLTDLRFACGGDKDLLATDGVAVTATLNLSLVSLAEFRLEEAEAHARWALAALERARSPHALRAQHNLALILDARGGAPEACALYEAVLARRRETLGDRHADSLRTASNLGILYARLGRAQGCDLLWETAEACASVCGPRDVTTLAARHNLSEALRMSGRIAEARAEAQHALDGRRLALGVHHEHTLKSAVDLALILSQLAPQDRTHATRIEAAALLREAARGYAETLGDDHAWAVRTRALAANADRDCHDPPSRENATAAAAGDGREHVAYLSSLDHIPLAHRPLALRAIVAALRRDALRITAVVAVSPILVEDDFFADAGFAVGAFAYIGGEKHHTRRLDVAADDPGAD